MSLEDLLDSEGLQGEALDDLVQWARDRAAELTEEVTDDPELGPMLTGEGESVPVPMPEPRVEARPAKAHEPLPPIPTARTEAPAATDEEEIEEIEELDADDLELVEEDEEEQEGEEEQEQEREDEEEHEQEEEREQEADAPPAEEPPAEEPGPGDEPPADADEPSSSEDAASDEAPDGAPTEPLPPDESSATMFGPPDGNEAVPDWKAALLSAQVGDEAAVEKLREESTVDKLPQPVEEEPPQTGRLVAEEEEIAHHDVDLSDLDFGDDEED